MADNRDKRKAWVHCKNTNIPKTTAWKANEKGNPGKCFTSDSLTRMSIDPKESVQSSCCVFET